MTLSEYLKLNNKDVDKAVLELTFCETESKLLEKFSFKEIGSKELYRWDCILDTIAENINQSPITFLSNMTLSNLLRTKNLLDSLAHLNLDDFWLLKIYETDNKNFEALIKVYKRMLIIQDFDRLKFLLLNYQNDFVLCYSLIDLLNTDKPITNTLAKLILSSINKQSQYYELINKYLLLLKSKSKGKKLISNEEIQEDIHHILCLRN